MNWKKKRMNKLKSKVNLNTELTKSKQKNCLGRGGGGREGKSDF